MKVTSFTTKKYILNDLYQKHFRTLDTLKEVANIGKDLSIKDLIKLDKLICKFNNDLENLKNYKT